MVKMPSESRVIKSLSVLLFLSIFIAVFLIVPNVSQAGPMGGKGGGAIMGGGHHGGGNSGGGQGPGSGSGGGTVPGAGSGGVIGGGAMSHIPSSVGVISGGNKITGKMSFGGKEILKGLVAVEDMYSSTGFGDENNEDNSVINIEKESLANGMELDDSGEIVIVEGVLRFRDEVSVDNGLVTGIESPALRRVAPYLDRSLVALMDEVVF